MQVSALTEELEQSRGGVRDQLKEKDAKINTLVEELGNSQAMLNDKVAELAEVRLKSVLGSQHLLLANPELSCLPCCQRQSADLNTSMLFLATMCGDI